MTRDCFYLWNKLILYIDIFNDITKKIVNLLVINEHICYGNGAMTTR